MNSGLGMETLLVDVEPRGGGMPCGTPYLATAQCPRVGVEYVPANACSTTRTAQLQTCSM